MPPFVARKRRLSTPPQAPTPKRAKKPTLFDTVDSVKPAISFQANQKFINELNDAGSDSSLSEAGSSDFEDVLPENPAKRRKVAQDEEDEEEMDWEDAIQAQASTPVTPGPLPSGDLELTLDKSKRIGSLTNPHDKKKGPSKIERQIRTSTHCMHVQFLMFHNLTRNGWCCDKEVQKILVDQLSAQMKGEVETWKRASGMVVQKKESRPSPSQRRGRGRPRGGRASDNVRSQRDWGRPAERLEPGMPNMSQGDPVIRLLKYLAAYWRKRFRITAPGLRKQGYKPLAVLEEEIVSFHNDKHDPEEHGEKIADLKEFRKSAQRGEGSRDLGAQLFTALIRGLGIEARLVANVQPIGFGWSKAEEAMIKKKRRTRDNKNLPEDSDTEDPIVNDIGSGPSVASKGKATKMKSSSNSVKSRLQGQGSSGSKDAPIKLSDDSDLSSLAASDDDADDESVVDVTPSVAQRKPNMNFDRDLPFPIYWTEVISPVTYEVYAVDSMVLTPSVATKQEDLASFEPRGAKADKAKQVIAYVIAYSQDGSAKEVTTRYLKRHMWPGKTKGMRMPMEKVPILNRRGKVKRNEEYDWFKTVMSGYKKHDRLRTTADDLEDAKDLKPIKPEKKEAKEGEETLQGYKQSAEYVLERHLRREEALLPASQPVKTFTSGKGDKIKEEPVYKRKDVVICRTGESWHKEGRQIKVGEYPMKMVPVRAMTLTRKREVEEAERDGGEKMMQGMFSRDQTEWIIPPPIENGVIPKNAFGNMDCFVPTMVPKGAIHIPLKGTTKVCKKLGIDYAEAVTGFEFGNQRAVPVITGVIVAEENEDLVIDAWEKDEEERKIKEEGKREKAALSMWRKFLMGLRIVERVREEYGGDAEAHMKEEMNPFTKKGKSSKLKNDGGVESPHVHGTTSPQNDHDKTMAGGFLPDDNVEGGFIRDEHNSEAHERHEDRGFILEAHETPKDTSVSTSSPEPPRREEPQLRFVGSADSDTSETDEDTEAKITPKLKRGPKAKATTKSTSNGAANGNASATKPRKARSSHTVPKTTPKARGRKPKPLVEPSVENEDNTAQVPDNSAPSPAEGHESQPALSKTNKPRPRRTAARKSETAVRSHYFAHDSDEHDSDTEGSGSDDEVEYKPKKGEARALVNGSTSKARRGRPRKTM